MVKRTRTSAASGRKPADPDYPSGRSTTARAAQVIPYEIYYYAALIHLSISPRRRRDIKIKRSNVRPSRIRPRPNFDERSNKRNTHCCCRARGDVTRVENTCFFFFFPFSLFVLLISIPIVRAGINPCDEAKCGPYEQCVINRQGIASCECGAECEPVMRPVCARGGKTYTSLCELKRQACLTRSNIEVAYTGTCGSRGPCSEKVSQAKCREKGAKYLNRANTRRIRNNLKIS